MRYWFASNSSRKRSNCSREKAVLAFLSLLFVFFTPLFRALPDEGRSEYRVAKIQAGSSAPLGPRSIPEGGDGGQDGGEEGGEGGREDGERSSGRGLGQERGKFGLRMFSMEK